MKRRGVVRFQVLLLAVLAVLLVWRASRGPGVPDSTIGLVGLEADNLYTKAFRMETDGRVRIEATGSLETVDSPVQAAYPWILSLADRSVAWRPGIDSVTEGGTLFTVIDTVRLAQGDYRAWYTTYGPSRRSRENASFLGLRHHWTSDQKSWRFLLSPVDSVRILPQDKSPEASAADWIWSSGPVRNRSTVEAWLVVDSPAEVRVRAVGEVCEGQCDQAVIENLADGSEVWSLSTSETLPAGGSVRNRAFDGVVTLDAGFYAARFETDGSQAYNSWDANPPWDPEEWGLSVGGPETAVHEFDPWATSRPVVSMLKVGNGELRRTTVDVSRPVRVVVDATGEMWDSNRRFDYAWIEREGRERIWEMTWDRTMPAGGDETNRREVAFLDLEPGRYVVYYQTDSRYAYDDWVRRRPDHPDRWGVAVFTLENGSQDSSAVHVVETASDTVADVPPVEVAPVPTPIPPIAGETLFEAVRLGNDVDTTGVFELARPTRVRVVALGEISRQERFDFGWIESESGDYAWEMTLGNTKPAGGDDTFRRFDSVLILPAGRFRAHFRTDWGKSYGDFGGGRPVNPEDWGMRIVRMPE